MQKKQNASITFPVALGGMNNILPADRIGQNQAVLMENVTYDETTKTFKGSKAFKKYAFQYKFNKIYEVLYNGKKCIFITHDNGFYDWTNNKQVDIPEKITDMVYNDDGVYISAGNKLYQYKDDVVSDIFIYNILLNINSVYTTGLLDNRSIYYHNILFNSAYDNSTRVNKISKINTKENPPFIKEYLTVAGDVTFFIYQNYLYVFVNKALEQGYRLLKYKNEFFQEPVQEATEFINIVNYSDTLRKPKENADSNNYIYSDSQLICLSYYNDIPAVMSLRRSNPNLCDFFRFDGITYSSFIPNYRIDSINFIKNYTYDNIISPTGKKFTISITIFSCPGVTKPDNPSLYQHFITCYYKADNNSWGVVNSLREYMELSLLDDTEDRYFIHKVSDNELVYTGYEKFYKINLFNNPENTEQLTFNFEELYLNYPSESKTYYSTYDKINNTFYLGSGSSIYKLEYITNRDTIPFLQISNARLIVAQKNMLLYSGVGDFNNWQEETDADALFLEVGYKDGGNIIAGAITYGSIIVFKDNGYIYRVYGDYPNWTVVKIAETDSITSNIYNMGGTILFGIKTGVKQINPTQVYGDFLLSDFQNSIIANEVTSISESQDRKTIVFCSKDYVFEYHTQLNIFYIYQAEKYTQMLEHFSNNNYIHYALRDNSLCEQGDTLLNDVTIQRALIHNQYNIVIKSITLYTDTLQEDTEIEIEFYKDKKITRTLKAGQSKHKFFITVMLKELQLKYKHNGSIFINNTIIELMNIGA